MLTVHTAAIRSVPPRHIQRPTGTWHLAPRPEGHAQSPQGPKAPLLELPGGHGKTAQSEIAPKGVAAAGSAHASSLAQPSSLSALADFLRSSLATRAAEAEEQSGVRRPLRRQWRSCAGRPLMHRVAAAAAPTAAAGPWAAVAAGRACPGHARNLRVTSSSGLDVSWQCKAHALASGSVC